MLKLVRLGGVMFLNWALSWSAGRSKIFCARSPSLFGMTVYKEVMSIVKINLFSPEKVKSRKIFSAWLVSLMWDGKDFTKGTMILSK